MSTCTCTHGHIIPYSEKTFVNFAVLWVFVKVFCVKFESVASLGAAKDSNPRKISQQKSYFSPICESFLPQKFPAIRYKNISSW